VKADRKVLIYKVKPRQKIDGNAVASLQEIIAGIEDGTVTGFAIAAKQDGFSRWTVFRAMTNADRYNLLGQLQLFTADLLAREEMY